MVNILTLEGIDGPFSINQKELTTPATQSYIAEQLGISVEELRRRIAKKTDFSPLSDTTKIGRNSSFNGKI